MPIRLDVGDIVELKKKHPCGGRRFEILYAGMDFRIKCLTCGTQMRMPRRNLEKRVTGIEESNREG